MEPLHLPGRLRLACLQTPQQADVEAGSSFTKASRSAHGTHLAHQRAARRRAAWRLGRDALAACAVYRESHIGRGSRGRERPQWGLPPKLSISIRSTGLQQIEKE